MLSARFGLSAFLLLVLSLQASSTWAVPPGEAHIYKTVNERDLSLYVTKPSDWKASDKRPAIVFYHGGGWVGGAPGQFTEHAAYLASRGMVAIQVQYRLLDRKSSDPPVTCVADAKSAMRWVRGHAGQLGIDSQRIASAGGSAGGHLAAFVGMVEGGDADEDDKSISAKSNAMVLFNAVFENGPGGWGHKRVGDRYEEFSPFHNASQDDPPSIVFLGSQDKLIPEKTAHDFKANVKEVGVDCEVIIYEGQGHGFFNHGRNDNKYYDATVLAMDKFLASLGWLEGPPTLKSAQ